MKTEYRIVKVFSLGAESYDVEVRQAGFGETPKECDWGDVRDFTYWVVAFGEAQGGEVVDAGYRSYEEAKECWPKAK